MKIAHEKEEEGGGGEGGGKWEGGRIKGNVWGWKMEGKKREKCESKKYASLKASQVWLVASTGAPRAAQNSLLGGGGLKFLTFSC